MRAWPVLLIAQTLMAGLSFAQPDSLWSQRFGGQGEDICHVVKELDGGGFILAGEMRPVGSNYADLWVIRTDAQGQQLWDAVYGGAHHDRCHDLLVLPDGGFILAGETRSFGMGNLDFWVLRLTATGDTLWTRTLGGPAQDRCYSIAATDDGSFVVAGSSNSFTYGAEDMWLVKLSADGDSLWSSHFGGSQTDVCNAVRQTRDGGFILGGTTISFDAGNGDAWLLRAGRHGDSLWSRVYGQSRTDACTDLMQTADGGFAFTGYTDSFGASSLDLWVAGVDSMGLPRWNHTFGGGNLEFGWALAQSPTGAILAVGETASGGSGNNDFWGVMLNSSGDSLWNFRTGGTAGDVCYAVDFCAEGGCVMAGKTFSLVTSSWDFWLVRAYFDMAETPKPPVRIPEDYLLQAYPNPFNTSVRIAFNLPRREQIELLLYDVTGRRVNDLAAGVWEAGGHEIHFDGAGLASGAYFLRLRTPSHDVTHKLIRLQ